jgi:hypothetical protein
MRQRGRAAPPVRGCTREALRQSWALSVPHRCRGCLSLYLLPRLICMTADWEKIADEAFARIMKPKLSVEEATPLGYKDCEEEEKNFLDSKIMKLEKEKFKCAICGKCFKGYEYVERHIPYRHSSDLIEHRNKVGCALTSPFCFLPFLHQTLRFNNFVLDPCRPSNVFAPKYYSVYPYAPFIAGMGSVAPPVSFYPPYSPFMVQSYAGPYGRLKQYSGPALAGALHYPSPYYPHPANRFQRPVFSAVPFSRNPYRGGKYVALAAILWDARLLTGFLRLPRERGAL